MVSIFIHWICAGLVLTADILSRIVLWPGEIPVGYVYVLGGVMCVVVVNVFVGNLGGSGGHGAGAVSAGLCYPELN